MEKTSGSTAKMKSSENSCNERINTVSQNQISTNEISISLQPIRSFVTYFDQSHFLAIVHSVHCETSLIDEMITSRVFANNKLL